MSSKTKENSMMKQILFLVLTVTLLLSQAIFVSATGDDGAGSDVYWDPAGGDDANDGLTKDTGVKTFSAAEKKLGVGGIIWQTSIFNVYTGTESIKPINGIVTVKRDPSYIYSLISVDRDAVLTIENVIFDGGGIDAGGAIASISGTLNIKNGVTLCNNKVSAALGGGGVYINGTGLLRMSGNAKISGNSSPINGGGVFVCRGQLEMSGNAKISGNSSSDRCGGVYFIPGGGSCKISGAVTIADNTGENCNLTDSVVLAITGELKNAGKTANIHIAGTNTTAPFAKGSGYILTQSDRRCFTLPEGYLAELRSLDNDFIRVNQTLSSLSVTRPPDKTRYKAGELFDKTGMEVTANYRYKETGMKRLQVTEFVTVTPSTKLSVSDKRVTISYTEGGVTKTTTQFIIVEEGTDTESDLDNAPKKGTTFTAGTYTYTITNAKTDGSGMVTLTGLAKGKSVTKVTVPKTTKYKGFTYKVTAVGKKAFYGNTKIKSAVISNNVAKIDTGAFNGCTKLTTVTIGNKVTAISSNVFYKCTKLRSVTIGTGLKELGNHLFCHNKAFRTLTIKSKKLTKVGKHNLHSCTNLKIKVPSSKVKEYKNLFKNQSQKKNVKVTK